MKRTFAKVFLFVVGVVSIFAAVGRLVPQVEEHPPGDTAQQRLSDLPQG